MTGHEVHSLFTITVLFTHLQTSYSALNTEFTPHFMQLFKTCWYPDLHTHFLEMSTYCSTWLGPQDKLLSMHILLSKNLGGRHTQFPELSSTNPFLHTQNPLKSSYLKLEQLEQSKSRGPLHVKHFGLHFWHTIFSDFLSSKKPTGGHEHLLTSFIFLFVWKRLLSHVKHLSKESQVMQS